MFVCVFEFVNGFHVSAINTDYSNTFYRLIPVLTFNLIVARIFCCTYRRLIDLSFRIKLQGNYHECNCFKLISEFLPSGVKIYFHPTIKLLTLSGSEPTESMTLRVNIDDVLIVVAFFNWKLYKQCNQVWYFISDFSTIFYSQLG